MTGQVVALHGASRLLTKRQLAQHLGRSERWVELRVRDGMPSVDPTRRSPQRRFRLDQVEAWLHDGSQRPASLSQRVATLEEEVARLARVVDQ